MGSIRVIFTHHIFDYISEGHYRILLALTQQNHSSASGHPVKEVYTLV